MSSSGWLIPAWIIGAPFVAVILSLFLGSGSSSMGSNTTAPKI